MKKGDKLQFKEGNNVLYSQDFKRYRGVPSNVTFTVEERIDCITVLSAPGYGGNPYGNGKIYISDWLCMDEICRALWEKENPGRKAE